ncbi:hypothetical protein FJ987_14135 [Mesorhizobium sp. CU2]|uniref:hypothetical protein n=1 Tax=unclassified Mesorhizobium TaxID=325217 RepID=UPI001128F40A|nr:MULTISPECIES: hypothetical protein [unclassified Mesorhizobium]TPN86568.1 hypothetical protein FJ988_07250 [Mesorhizobium sp. CU3]TPO14402.1 hypothetical protein FJ987_14135 [Mesorhizobium sp. CU2]
MLHSMKLENLQFAFSMLREIRQQTKAAGEELLTYLIDMAYLEAGDRIREIQFEQTVAPASSAHQGPAAAPVSPR